MTSPTPSKPDRDHPVLICVVLVMTMVPIAITWMFLFGKLYGAIAFTISVLLLLSLMIFLRRRKDLHARLKRRVENALESEPSNDPRQMARWMR